jgi:ABC-type taurine transport system substrate-binding protein
MFCALYVGWLLAGVLGSTPTILAASRHITHKIYQLLYIQYLLMMSK